MTFIAIMVLSVWAAYLEMRVRALTREVLALQVLTLRAHHDVQVHELDCSAPGPRRGFKVT